ncbi:MAG: FtsX-like permease family protein [Phycisphaerae bacterium]|nr:FtsX-like permease family protein [Phycisphaerae bacterium]
MCANRVRSGLSVLGIVFGVAAVVAMLAVVEGARNDVLERLSRLGTNVLFVHSKTENSGVERGLQYGDAHRLAHISSLIDMVAPAVVVDLRKHESVIGVTPSYMSVRQLFLQSGRALTDVDLKNRARVCVVGREIVGSDGSTVGLGDVVHVNSQMYQVVGIIASEKSSKDRSLGSLLRNHNNAILIPMTTLPKSSNVVDDAILLTEITIRTSDAKDLVATSEVVERALSQGQLSKPSVEIIIPRQLLREEQHAQRVFASVVGCVAFIGVLVGGIGVMNIMLANVAERCKEIGIRRAVGATKKQIAMLFLIESILLTLFGGVGGLILGAIASHGIARFGGWSVSISIWSILLAFGTAGIVGLLAGWYPAKRAANLDPVDAMRRE